MKAAFKKAVVAMALALLLAVPLAGSALAKPILIDDFGSEEVERLMEAIDDTLEDELGIERPDNRPANHGWYVSSFTKIVGTEDFDDFVDDAFDDEIAEAIEDAYGDDLNRGQWVSLVARLLKANPGDDDGDDEDGDDDSDDERVGNGPDKKTTGKATAPGQLKKKAGKQSAKEFAQKQGGDDDDEDDDEDDE